MPNDLPLKCADLAGLIPAESEARRRTLEIAFWRGQLQLYGPAKVPVDPRLVVQLLQFVGGNGLPPLDDEDDLPHGPLDLARREQLVEKYLARYIADPPSWEPFWHQHPSNWQILPSDYAALDKSRGGAPRASRKADRDRQARIRAARETLRAKGMKFRNRKEEHAAVLKHCGIKEPVPRGWDYKTFCRLISPNSQ